MIGEAICGWLASLALWWHGAVVSFAVDGARQRQFVENRYSGPGNPYNRACGPLEMHPYRWLAPPLPPEGEVCSMLILELT